MLFFELGFFILFFKHDNRNLAGREVIWMPVITVESDKMDKQQKQALISAFTKSASEILNIAEQAFVVILKENSADNLGIGGKMLSKLFAERNQV
jgi:4-oxalocrotonate tautomerase